MVFVVDDDLAERRALSRQLRKRGFAVETFASAAEFLKRPPFAGDACLVLDVRLPTMSGLELQEELAASAASPPIVFITDHADVRASVQAMKRGAVDFLQKPPEEAALTRAIRAALELHRKKKERAGRVREVEARVKSLTLREREVFELVAAGSLNKQIAGKLGIAEKTVKVHRARVMRKMRAASVPDLVRAWDLVLPR